MIDIDLYVVPRNDVCIKQQIEFTDNPPMANVNIIHCYTDEQKQQVYDLDIRDFPAIILRDGQKEIVRFIGQNFSSDFIDGIIYYYMTL